MSEPRDLRLMFVTSMFPAPSEAFAAIEVCSLLSRRIDVRIATLRSAHPLARELCAESRMDPDDVDRFSLRSYLRGLIFAVRHPLRVAAASTWLVRHGWRKPGLLARTLIIAPRMLDIVRLTLHSKVDVLHLFWGHSASYIGHLMRQFDPRVIVSTSLGAYDLAYGQGPWIDLAREADVVWTHASVNRPLLESLGVPPEKIQVLRRGIDLSRIPSPAPRIPGKLVCVARLVPEKGVGLVLRAFEMLRRRFPSAHLTVIGEGPEKARFEALATQLGIDRSVSFTGPLPHRSVMAELANTDVFLLLSHSPGERLPNVVKEAMACGCICVLTESPGIDELIHPLRHRLVVERGDWQNAAALVEAVLSNPGEFQTDRDEGRNFILHEFDADSVASKRITAWRTLIARRAESTARKTEEHR